MTILEKFSTIHEQYYINLFKTEITTYAPYLSQLCEQR